MIDSPKLRFKEFIGNWESIKLSDFSEIITSGSRDWAKYYANDGDKFIRMTNLVRDGIRLNLEDLKFVKLPESSTEGTRSSLQYGDILISITAELGKLGWIPKNFGSAYINQHTALVRLNNQINSKFVAYLLSTTVYNNKLNGLNDAGAKAGLNLSTIRQFKIKIPSKVEQTKIADFLTTVDEKISQLNEQHQLMIQYKKGVMQKIFNQEIRFKDDNGEDFGEWEEKILGEISNPQQWKTISSSDMTESGYPVFGANGYIGFYSEYNHENETITVTCRGATCGEVTLVKPKTYITGNSMSIDDIDEQKYNVKFIYYALCIRGFSDVITGSAQPQIVGSSIKKVKFLVPCMKEQSEIANFLTWIDQRIENLAQQLEQAKNWKKGLLQKMFV
ncbi:restriction endonuclease subunit S [uncultured Haemophilus sp.]|uniref:restriction endonuclease subunit S n=1 Tax=uncultured Haemophilus sp. TaxID=237779 RepID=UPI0025CB879F|nr:restriction endonuclease subunit S [uncultured Haemophilus sp.]